METQKFDVELKSLTYYQIGGRASHFYTPDSISELQNWLFNGFPFSKPLAVIGSGSNIIFSDLPFNGTVISCRNFRSWHWLESGKLYCEAGVTNTELAEIGLDAGFSDAAWMYRMPGQLGATVRMNARCYGGEISEIVTDVFTLTLDGRLKHYSGRAIFKGYKDTHLMQSKEIVVALIVTFRSKKNFDEILASMNQNEADRHTKQHFLFPSCGSTFKNNYSIGKPSGRIFDELGLKGTKVGNAEISTFHGNFVFNKGSAQAVDVMSLAHLMRSKALENKMDLELEVQPIGCFDKKLAHDLALERLDPATIETSDGKVLTGILHSGETKAIECKQDENLDEILDEAPAIDSAFLGWTQEMSAQLGTLRFQVTRIDSLKDGAHKTLQIKFIAESPAHYERLISAAPELSGFQDKLWETSVFECFIFSADSEKYLELEVHSEDSWLALKLDSHRKRNKKSLIPSEDDFTGIRPFALLENETIEYSKSQSKRIGLGFEIELSILQQLLGTQENFCLIRGAYAHGPQKLYAIAPGLGFVEENEKPQPDFHKRSGVFHIRLFDTMHKK